MLLVNAVILLAISAFGALTMAVMYFRRRSAPRALLAAAHGLFVTGGLVTLVCTAVSLDVGHTIGIALALFLLAAVGGFTLLIVHVRGRLLSSAPIMGHGA